MVVNINRSLIENSTARSVVFGAAAGGFLLAGVYIGEVTSTPQSYQAVDLALLSLGGLLAVTAAQAYYHGSTILAFALIMAGPLGFFIYGYLVVEQPSFEMLVGLPMTVAFLFGAPGHLWGSHFAKVNDAFGDPSTLGQILIATAMFGLLILQILDKIISIPIV